MAVGLRMQGPCMVGVLGTLAGRRVLDIDDDEGSGTSRFVYDVRSHRPVDQHDRRMLCTENNASYNGRSPG